VRLFLIIVSLILTSTGIAQDTSWLTPAATVEGSYVDFNVDNLGNYYLLSKDNQLKKLNAKGDSMGVFNDVRRYGKLYSIDVTNPLKVLLYYKNFSTIVVLDRFLNVINTIDLRKQNIFQVKAIAQSYDNNIWIYDEQNNKLKKIGEDGRILFESVDFRIIFDQVPAPFQIIDREGFVYLNDPSKGVFVFDIYGSFKTKVSYIGIKTFTVFGKTLVGLMENQLFTYQVGTLTEQKAALPAIASRLQKAVLTPGHLYMMVDGSVLHYTF
jgi:hypothetical protein